MIARRYENDGEPSIRLDARQKQSIAAFKSKRISWRRRSCVICEGVDFEVLSGKNRYGLEYYTGLCLCCGNIQQYKYYDQETLCQFYADDYRKIYGAGGPEALFEQLRNQKGPAILAFCSNDLMPHSKVLEIGCGSGGTLFHFAKHGFDVTGIDLDRQYLEFGVSRGPRLQEASIENFTSACRYDPVILSHVLEHLTDPGFVLAKIKSLLVEDGFLYIEVPSIHSVRTSYEWNFLEYFQNAHFLHFTRETLGQLMRRNGYVAIRQNDFIQSLWAPTSADEKIDEIENFYESTVSEINDIEKTYRSRIRYLNFAKRVLRTVLSKTGLLAAVRRIKRRLIMPR